MKLFNKVQYGNPNNIFTNVEISLSKGFIAASFTDQVMELSDC